MALVALILDPGRLTNPDLDLRYEVPQRISDASSGLLVSVGYGYDSQDRIHVYLETEDLPNSLELIRGFLQTTRLLDNDLSDVQVAIREAASGPLALVWPEHVSGSVEDLDEIAH